MVDEAQEVLEDEVITEEDLGSVIAFEKEIGAELIESEVIGPTKEEIAALAEANQKAELEAKEAAEIAKAKEVEEARVVEEARQQDLKDRYAGLVDKNMASAQLNIGNPDLHFNTFIMAEKNHATAEGLMLELEAMDKKCQAKIQLTAHLENRKIEYAQIDILLLEGLAEREEGREEKMKLYNEKRAEIREKYPKV